MNEKLNYPLTFSSWDYKEILEIQKVIKSGQFTYASEVKNFEKKYAQFFKMKHAIMVNSGASANLVSIASLFFKKKRPLKKGDEVIVPAISWSTTYSPLQQYGLKLKFVDVDFDTLNIDTEKLKKAISKKTKLIVLVSILGNPCNIHEIAKICKDRKIFLMEDNCESLGAKYKNKYTGTSGDINTMSFFYSHHISAIEGGMVTTNNDELADLIRSIRSHGWTRDVKNLKNLGYSKKKFETYQFILPGYNVRPTEINAATGATQLKKLNNLIKERRKNFTLYQKIFRKNKIFHIQKENGFSSSFSFVFIFKKKYLELKNKIYEDLKKNNIQYRLITGGCFTKHPVKKYFDYKIFNNLNNANYIHDNGFFLGNAPYNLEEQLIHFNKVIIKYY